MRPLLKPSVILCPSDDSYLAYDIDSNQLHRLSPLAALIIESADGQMTTDELVDQVMEFLQKGNPARCHDWISQISTLGLLIDAESSQPLPEPTADRLHALATELRDNDQVLAAFVCQNRACQLAPNEPDYWYQLGKLANLVGRRSESLTAFEQSRRLGKTGPGLGDLLAAYRSDVAPARIKDRCVEDLRNQVACVCDSHNPCDHGIGVEDRLADALLDSLGSRRDVSVLDVGCGTGQFGLRIKNAAHRLIGIDLSANQIERARDRHIYDDLEISELSKFLSRKPNEQFDLIAMGESLEYFGDLNQILLDAARYLAPGGRLGFAVEQGSVAPFQLTDSGRFVHQRDYLQSVAEAGGFRVVSQTSEVLRHEGDKPVMGWITVLAEQEN